MACPPEILRLLKTHPVAVNSILCAGDDPSQRFANQRIFLGAAAWGGPVGLTPRNVARIDSRSDEHYRQKMLKL